MDAHCVLLPIHVFQPIKTATILFNSSMTGIEVLGIVAAVFQLSQQTIAISSALGDIYGTVRAAPAKLKDGERQLDRLVEIAKVIEQNQLIQTEAVQTQLYSIVNRTDTLRKLITRISSSSNRTAKKYWRVVTGNVKEKEMIEHFDQIEKEKTGLILIIMEVHASLSGETLKAVKPISAKVDDMQRDVQQLNVSWVDVS
jgi:hypothetical protein